MTQMWVKITHGVSYGLHKDVFCLRAVRLLWVGGWVRSCSLQSKGKDRLLGRGAASRVCCWPDQLAQLLSSGGVAHHNKGLWADRRLHSSYQPPSLRRSTALLLSRPSCGMQRANMEVLSFGKNQRDINLEHMIAAHSAV